MQSENILEELMTYLEHHVHKAQGLPCQESYKGELFKIFQAAYREGLTEQPPLTGDNIKAICEERWRQYWREHPEQLLQVPVRPPEGGP